MSESVVTEVEQELHTLATDLTAVRPRECLLCYVYRMLEHGCVGLRWALHYRDTRAPRATSLERRLEQQSAYCDCEIFANAYQLAPHLLVRPEPVVEDGVSYEQEYATYPDPLPDCLGVRAGNTRGCGLWVENSQFW